MCYFDDLLKQFVVQCPGNPNDIGVRSQNDPSSLPVVEQRFAAIRTDFEAEARAQADLN